MRDDLTRDITGRFDMMYYWDQFQPIIAAVAILLLGWSLLSFFAE